MSFVGSSAAPFRARGRHYAKHNDSHSDLTIDSRNGDDTAVRLNDDQDVREMNEHAGKGDEHMPYNSTFLEHQSGKGGKENLHPYHQRGNPHARDNLGRANHVAKNANLRSSDGLGPDLTAETATESILDEERPAHGAFHPDGSFIPGVGRGHNRRSQPLPFGHSLQAGERATNARKVNREAIYSDDRQYHDSEDSESAIESSSASGHSTSNFQRQHPFPHRRNQNHLDSFAQSTGNHIGFMKSPVHAKRAGGANVNHAERPTLPLGWQRGMDEAFDPSRKSSRKTSDKHNGAARIPGSLRTALGEAAESASNESGYAAGSNQQKRKASHGSSARHPSSEKVSGAEEASTSGETLVEFAGAQAEKGGRNGERLASDRQSAQQFSRKESNVNSPFRTRNLRNASPRLASLEGRSGHDHREEFDRAKSHFIDVREKIDGVNDKVDRIERASLDMRRDVSALRHEWVEWQHKYDKPVGDHYRSPVASHRPLMAPSNLRNAKVGASEVEPESHDRPLRHRSKSDDRFLNNLQDERDEKELEMHQKRRGKEPRPDLALFASTSATLPSRKAGRGFPNVRDYGVDNAKSIESQVDAVVREVRRLRTLVTPHDERKQTMSSPIKGAQYRPTASRVEEDMMFDPRGTSERPQRYQNDKHDRDSADEENVGFDVQGQKQGNKTSGREKNDVDDRVAADDEFSISGQGKKQGEFLGRSSEREADNDFVGTFAKAASAKGYGQEHGRRVGSHRGEEPKSSKHRAMAEQEKPLYQNDAVALEDVSVLADTRAAEAFARAVPQADRNTFSDQHDAQHCIHCLRLGSATGRKDGRKCSANRGTSKNRHSSLSFDEENEEVQARALLARALHELEGLVEAKLPSSLLQLASKQRALLEQEIRDQMDDFFHAKRTYSELADELKTFHPDMSATKRQILAHHVIISVEGLERLANRINRLRAALAATLPGAATEGYDQPKPSRQSNRSHSTARHRPRNSPPIVDFIEREEVEAYDSDLGNY